MHFGYHFYFIGVILLASAYGGVLISIASLVFYYVVWKNMKELREYRKNDPDRLERKKDDPDGEIDV